VVLEISASESWHKGINIPSSRSPVADKETGSHPEMVGDMSRVANRELWPIKNSFFVHF